MPLFFDLRRRVARSARALALVAALPATAVAQNSGADTLLVRILDELQAIRQENAELRQRLGSLAGGLSYVRSELQRITSASLSDSLAPTRRVIEFVPVTDRPQDTAPSEPVVLDVSEDAFLGDARAPLTLVEFSDFQCPFCGRHARQTVGAIDSAFVQSGRVKYVFKHYPIDRHPQAALASEAALCAGDQGQFWEMHHWLFEHQDALQPADLLIHARSLGLDVETFRSCLESGRFTSRVEGDKAIARLTGLRATPHFALGITENEGKAVRIVRTFDGAKPLEAFVEEIERVSVEAP